MQKYYNTRNRLICCYLLGLLFSLQVTAAETVVTNSDIFDEGYSNFLKSFVCSQPIDGITAGIKVFNCSQSNIFVGLLAANPEYSNALLIAPPQFQRVEYYLYDSSNRAVPYLTTYHPSNKLYKTVSDVPKNRHNVHEGTIRGPLFYTPYSQATLAEMFQIDRDGNYKLVAKVRIMKINADSSLSTVEFTPVTLMIHLGRQRAPNSN